ncbi:MAG TPA: extracellular solute-binding protein, partial [Ignavibacteriaceae bacterium]|nr:extracellular solute-binding protein [Ignavibacteriaceae bacterium]
MKFEKLAYVIISTILVTVFILFSYIFSPFEFDKTSHPEKKIYYVDNISAAHQKVIDRFNEKFKGKIEVVAINLSFDKFSTNERKELLARYLRSRNDRIDIFAVDQIWVPRFAKWGVPLDKYFSEDEKNNLLSFATETCFFEDTLVSIPLYIDIALMFYRDDLIKTLPDYEIIKDKIENSITWEDFIELRKRFNGNQPFYVFQADDYEGLLCSFAELMSNQNSKIITTDSVYLQTAEGNKALQTLVDLINNYNVSPKEVIKFKENPSYNFFLENDGIFLRGWPGFLSKDNKTFENKPEIFANLKRAPLPHLKGTKPGSVFGGWNLMVSKYSTKVPEIIKFAQFFISEEAQKI